MIKYILIMTVILTLGACSSLETPSNPNPKPTPTQPENPETSQPETEDDEVFSGHWSGTVKFESYEAKLTLRLEQDLVFLRGEGLLTVEEPLYKANLKGKISGMLKYDEVHFELIPDDPKYCYYRAKAIRNPETLMGSFVGVNCVDKAINGQFVLEKVDAENEQ